jgi:hypothetical protein
MKKKLALVPFLIGMSVFSYLEKTEWETIKKEGQVTSDVQAKLDELMGKNPNLKRCFVDKNMKFVTPISGPSPDPSNEEFMERMGKQGYRVSESDPNFFEYRTTPNHNFPGTYDPTVHASFDDCPLTKTINYSTTSQVREKVAHYCGEARQVLEQRQAFLEAAELRNLSHSGNITVVLDEPPCVLKGTSRDWTTPAKPRAVERYVNAHLWQKYFYERGFAHLRTPETRLYHFGGQSEELSDCNWAAVEQRIMNPLSWQEILEEAGKPRGVREKVFDELETLLDPAEKNPVWNSLVNTKRAADGSIVEVTKLDILFVREKDGLCAYFPDAEGPSLAGAFVDEQRSKEFSTTHLPLYGPKSEGSTSWFAFMGAAAVHKQEQTNCSFFERMTYE